MQTQLGFQKIRCSFGGTPSLIYKVACLFTNSLELVLIRYKCLNPLFHLLRHNRQLQDVHFLEETVSKTEAERTLLYKSFGEMGLSYVESSTNFILVDVKKDSDLVTDALEKRGIIVRSAKNYGAPTSIRVTVGKREQNKKFIRALDEALKEL